MNLLEIVPPFKRHLGMYQDPKDTDSNLAAYLADATEALMYRWSRTYAVTYIAPNSYSVSPDIMAKDKRPIVLMGSIIYKMGNLQLANFRDQDFSYNPQQGRQNPIQVDVEELARYLPIYRLAKAVTAPLRGYNNMINPESYNRILFGTLGTDNSQGSDGLINGGADWEWYNLL
jgi:hypothetical protein